MALSTMRYRSRRPLQEALRLRLRELAATHVRYGYRRLTVLLRREGWAVNAKRVYRLYDEEQLKVRSVERKKIGRRQRAAQPPASGPNQCWAADFVSDKLADGRAYRILTVIDQFTRECIALVAERSMSGSRVVAAFTQACAERGATPRGWSAAFHRFSRTMRTRGLSGRTRRAAFVFPFVISSTPFRPPSQVMFSHLRQWHSSGRIPVSNNTTETSCNSGEAAARYNASSLDVMTRSRRCSPLRNLTFGEASITPHSTASRSTRRNARKQLFTELVCKPSRWRSEAYSATSSAPISSSFKFAIVGDFLSESIPNLYQSQVLGDACSKVDFAHGSTREPRLTAGQE